MLGITPVVYQTGGVASGTRAYVTSDASGLVSIINTLTDTVIGTITVGTNPRGICFNPLKTKLYVANYGSNNVSVIDVATELVTNTITVGTNPYRCVVSPDGTKLYVTNYSSSTVSVISTATNTVTATISLTAGNDCIGIDITPDGSKLYVACYAARRVKVIATSTNTVTATITYAAPDRPYGVSIDPLGVYAYVSSDAALASNSSIKKITISTDTHLSSLVVGTDRLQGIKVSPDGTDIYAAIYSSADVAVVSVASFTVTNTIDLSGSPAANSPNDVAFSSDGLKAFVTGSSGFRVKAIDTSTETVSATISLGAAAPFGVVAN